MYSVDCVCIYVSIDSLTESIVLLVCGMTLTTIDVMLPPKFTVTVSALCLVGVKVMKPVLSVLGALRYINILSSTTLKNKEKRVLE